MVASPACIFPEIDTINSLWLRLRGDELFECCAKLGRDTPAALRLRKLLRHVQYKFNGKGLWLGSGRHAARCDGVFDSNLGERPNMFGQYVRSNFFPVTVQVVAPCVKFAVDGLVYWFPAVETIGSLIQ